MIAWICPWFTESVTAMCMVVKQAKRVSYTFQMEGLTTDEIVWKYMEQICGTEFQEISKRLGL